MKERPSQPGWYRVFPMGVEQKGSLRASMILRYSPEMKQISPAGWQRRDVFCPRDGVPLLLPLQVHGHEILRAEPRLLLPLRPLCDGILLDQSNLRVALRFADCFPVLLWGMEPKPWIMGLHSGFKGTLLNICGRGVRILEDSLGIDVFASCNAWIGPGICSDCYVRTVGDPFTAEVKAGFPEKCWTESDDGVHPDLGKMITTQLAGAGIPPENITQSSLCSSCDRHICYSYRRGDVLPRMWLFFEIRDSLSIGQKREN